MALVQRYAASNCEESFATLVQRHIALVYSTALRQVHNAHAAEEITQAVFVILAQKAPRLSPSTILSGWLYQTTRFAATSHIRGEIRRQKREQEAHLQSMLDPAQTNSTWEQIAPILDEAMSQLGEKDRNAVVLRFFENKSVREIAATLEVRDEAAQKRVTRAVDKLRNFFAKRGYLVPATALAGALSTNAVQAAPANLAASVTATAGIKGAAVSSSTLTIIKGALKIMAWTKIKTAVAVGAAVLLATGTTVAVKNILPTKKHVAYSADVDNEAFWQLNSMVLDQAPPMVLIRPTHFPDSGGWVSSGQKFLGKNATLETIIQIANGFSKVRTVYPPNLPAEKFDFIASVPDGRRALRDEIKKQFGLSNRTETREVPVLSLKVKTGGAPKLKVGGGGGGGGGGSSSGNGKFKMDNQPIGTLASTLENAFNQPVVDQTGLTQNYDVELKWSAHDTSAAHQSLQNALEKQLGLEVVPSTAPVKMLIIEQK